MSLNRQNNSSALQGNTNQTSLQASSNMPTSVASSGRVRSDGGVRRQNRGRGGTRSPAPNFRQSNNRRGGRQGRDKVGSQLEHHTRNDDQYQELASKDINDSSEVTTLTEIKLSDCTNLQGSLEASQKQQDGSSLNDTSGSLSNQAIPARNPAVTPSAQAANLDRSSIQPSSRSNKSLRTVGGKYKQRREARQMIDGIDGFDIDLLETLTPSNADNQNRSRHQTHPRKINLSHLVNFSYDRSQRSGNRKRHDSGSNERGLHHNTSLNHQYRYQHSGEHKFNKQQFLQANCQFVVLDGYDYTIHKVNPDWPVDWNCIEEVKFRQTGVTETNCPICLEPPIAAKITKCGHIYCWACMLRYVSLSDEKNVPCPICFEPIYVEDLRSVVSQSYSNHVVGETIKMQLMFRRKGCVEVDTQTRQEEISNETDPHYSSNANLIIVDPMTVVIEIAQRERNELEVKMELETLEITENEASNPSYSGMICFIEQALDQLRERVDHLIHLSSDKNRSLRVEHQRLTASQSTEFVDTTSRSYSFYQSADRQHIYLNPFSTKILCQEYGSLENCPCEIQAEVLQMDWISMNEAWRKRFKYLEHLPLTCEFRLIEIDFEKSNLISNNTYKRFEEQIKARAKDRARRLREEAKRDRLIQVEQNRKIYGIQPSLEISLDNPEQFPSVSNESYFGLEQSREPNDEDSTDEENSDDQNQKLDDKTDEVILSFAEIQLEEAAKMEKASRKQKQQSNSNVWPGAANRPKDYSNQPRSQSSFAQLLVDAKSSQQKWTKSTGASSSKSGGLGSNRGPVASQSMNNPNEMPQSLVVKTFDANDPDQGGEELRAPPCEFTISDYLDLNVVSGKKKGKKKKS